MKVCYARELRLKWTKQSSQARADRCAGGHDFPLRQRGQGSGGGSPRRAGMETRHNHAPRQKPATIQPSKPATIRTKKNPDQAHQVGAKWLEPTGDQ